jgi:hypothetical protein
MTYEEIMDTIIQSTPKAWNYEDTAPTRTMVYRHDLSITMEFKASSTSYKEPWIFTFPNELSNTAELTISYEGSPVTIIPFVQVDEGKKILPQPPWGQEKPTVHPDYLHLAKLLNGDMNESHYYAAFAEDIEIPVPWPK